jgi:hypothetical protein
MASLLLNANSVSISNVIAIFPREALMMLGRRRAFLFAHDDAAPATANARSDWNPSPIALKSVREA